MIANDIQPAYKVDAMGRKRPPLAPYLQGVRDIEGIRMRCYVCEDTGCWHWRGTMGKRSSRPGREPMVWLADERKTTTVMRAAWLFGRATPLKRGMNVWRRCRSVDCANPKHMMAGTKAEWGAWASAKGYLKGRPERVLINQRLALESGRSKLTGELVQWVRESPQTGLAVAWALGVSPQVVSRIRTGAAHKTLPMIMAECAARAATAKAGGRERA